MIFSLLYEGGEIITISMKGGGVYIGAGTRILRTMALFGCIIGYNICCHRINCYT